MEMRLSNEDSLQLESLSVAAAVTLPPHLYLYLQDRITYHSLAGLDKTSHHFPSRNTYTYIHATS